MGLGRIVSRGIRLAVGPAVKGAVKKEALKVAKQIAPSPGEIVSAAQKAVDQMRDKNPEVMNKISSATSKVVETADVYFPGVVQRAREIVASAPDASGNDVVRDGMGAREAVVQSKGKPHGAKDEETNS